MSILFRDRPVERVLLPPGYGDQYVSGSRGSSALSVNVDSSMRHDAVWSCRTRIAEDVSMMPVDVVRYAGPEREVVFPTPQIIATPSAFTVDSMDWRYQIIMSWTGCGNVWGLVTQTTADMRWPTRIELCDESSVRVQYAYTGATPGKVEFYVNNEEEELWPAGRLWHWPAYTIPGRLLGLSPIQYHATTIGKGMAAGLHGFQYFTDGAHPTSIWKLKGATAEQAKSFKDRLMSLVSRNREPLTVDADVVDMVQLQSNPTDSQFLDTEKYSVEQVCRIFNCDPADHGSSSGGSSITYANRSDADLARLKRRQYWITKMQNMLTATLPRPQVVKLNTSAFLMMTDMERHRLHDLRLKNKTQSINAVHDIEDEPRVDDPDYDLPGIPGGNPPEPAKVVVSE